MLIEPIHVRGVPVPGRALKVLAWAPGDALFGTLRDDLATEGARFVRVSCLAEARAVLQPQSPDVIVIDLGLTGDAGLTLVRDLQTPSWKPCPPVLLITDGQDPRAVASWCDLDIAGHVVRPVTAAELDRKIRMVLSRESFPGRFRRSLRLRALPE